VKKELLCLCELSLSDEYRDSSGGAVASLGAHGGLIERVLRRMDASTKSQQHPAVQKGSPRRHPRLLRMRGTARCDCRYLPVQVERPDEFHRLAEILLQER
jgi:hypothetical protein